jgi:flavin reductase (DIM6/NTAB) family NADH-FMN oxidoreductase RutF
MFSACGLPEKDTLINVRETGEFVWNLATFELRDKVVGSAATFGADVDEFEALDIAWLDSVQVKPRRVAVSPIHFECRAIQFVEMPSESAEGKATVVFGSVVGIHIRDDVLTDSGRVDVVRLRPLARLGYLDYTTVSEAFEIHVPPPVGRYKPVEGLRASSSGLFHMSELPKKSGAA